MNKSSFSLAFLLVGLPSLFILREFQPIDKKLFTYALMGVNLLLLINYKNLLKLRFYFNISLAVRFSIFVVLSLFLFISYDEYGLNDQTIYLLITLYIYLALYTIVKEDLDDFFKYVLVLSSISVYLAFFLTPLDINYWSVNGGRFYLGDTKNPGVVSVLTAVNIITIFFYMASPKKKLLYSLSLLPLLGISPYLYFLSQGKSTIIGIIITLLFVVYNSAKDLKKLLYYMLITIIIGYIFIIFFHERVEYFTNSISGAALSLFGFDNEFRQMSAEVRNENFQKTWDYMSFDNIFGHGINTFRMDSPFLQTAVDFGNVMAIVFFYTAVIYPFLYIIKTDYKMLDVNSKLSILLYLFYFQNLFFHGTPYDYSIWLPLLLLLKIPSSRGYYS